MNDWVHNLSMLYSLIAPSRCVSDLLQVPSTRRWTGLVILPVGLTQSEAVHHRDLQDVDIIGGWPLIAAFYTYEEFLLAKLRFS
jgi:hypothetical protein